MGSHNVHLAAQFRNAMHFGFGSGKKTNHNKQHERTINPLIDAHFETFKPIT